MKVALEFMVHRVSKCQRSQDVLACQGCCNKYQRPGDLSNRKLLSQFWGAGSRQIKVAADLISPEDVLEQELLQAYLLD